ncbi:MAG: chorismate-binding protein, partial [Rhodospirillales bacterium]|nr:chorismate-binding protein [Rhodospirillales bacterium]
MQIAPSREAFIALAADAVIVPVWTDLLGDTMTAVGAFGDVAPDGPAFLLESVEGGDRWARWSFLGWDPLFVLTSRHGLVTLEGADIDFDATDPLTALESLLSRIRVPDLPGMPPLHTGMVGYLAYDVVRYVEHLPNPPRDDRGLPEMLWMGVGTLAAFDRFAQRIRLLRNVLVGEDPGADYDRAVVVLAEAAQRITSGPGRRAEPVPAAMPVEPAVASMTAAGYGEAVERAVAHIRAGDAFQVVPSVRFEVPFGGDPFAVYRMLRLLNPSPAMFFLRAPGVAIAGSSPELLVRVRDGRVFSRPIAGTRRRG